MTWTNAFDVGACTVEVVKTAVVYWSGVLAKGQTSPTFQGYYGGQAAGEPLHVEVSASGVASLINEDDTTNHAGGYDLRVIPSYAVAGYGARVSGILVTGDAPDSAFASSSDADVVPLTPPAGNHYWTPTTVTPDPAALASAPDYLAVNSGPGV